jgi:LacI family transcriptional regulator
MTRRVTIKEVAAQAGVHKATAARALNSRTESLVNATTLKRILRVADQLGYVPNAIARSLSTDLSLTIGLIVPDLTNPIFPPIARGIESFLSPRGYTALIANTDSRPELEEAVFASMLERRVDGFIMATGRTDHPLLHRARERGVHIVLVNRSVPGVDYSLVAPDMLGGLRLAMAHLVGLGHRKVLHFAGPPSFTVGNTRTDEFLRDAADAGLSARVVVAEDLSIESGYRLMARELSTGLPHETALISSNDLLAIGAMQALRDAGFRCPLDMSVTGFNDMRFAELVDPPLTTLRVPYDRVGSEAARLLLEGLGAVPAPSLTVTLSVELIVRGSTAAPRAN